MNEKLRPLQELCSLGIERVNPALVFDDEFWYVDISSIDNVTKSILNPTLTKSNSASVRARQVILEKDVLVSTTRPNLNAVAIVPDKYDGQICSTGFCVLRCSDELDPDYLFNFTRSSLFVNSLSNLVQGALYPAVTDKQVFTQVIPWVPIEKQRQIATHLKAQLDGVIKARKAAEAQLQDSTLLRCRILNEIFSVLQLSPTKRLGDFAETTSGSTPARGNNAYWENGKIPWVKTGEVAFKQITKTEEHITEQALKECSLKILPVKTVLIAMYGQGKTRGQSAILEVAATTNQACFAILPNETWEPEFLYLWLVCSYQDLRDLSEDRGGNQANLNGALLKALEVPSPTRKKQLEMVKKINSALKEIDAIKQSCESTLSDINSMPNRLLAQAFEM